MLKARSTTELGPIGRALRNAGWLLGGKGVGGLFSLVYLALAARSLGVAAFGVFALILTYGQAAANIVQFQSWQTFVRYGAAHLAGDRPHALRRLVAFTVLLDLGAASVGALIAAAGTWVAAPLFGWSGEEQHLAALFSLSLVFGLRGTPTGVLRLYDRFDLAAYSETVLPAMRLVGAGIAFATGPTIGGFLLAWAVAELVTTVAMWTTAARELGRHDIRQLHRSRPAGVVAENPGLWRFAWSTNLTASINLVWQQLPTLAVGWIAGPATAGGYRIAVQLTSALNKPALSLTRSIYPEFAKLAVDGGPAALTPMMRRAARLSAVVGLGVVLLIAIAGEFALTLVGGGNYGFAYPFLVLLSIAAAIDLSGFSLEPALVAIGRPGRILFVRAIAGAIYAALLVGLVVRFGAIGAPVAAICASMLVLTLMLIQWRRAAHGR